MSISKQDMQSIVETAKNRVIERMLTRQEMQILSDTSRDRIMNHMQYVIQTHQQQTFTRDNDRSVQTQRYISSLESRIGSLESEIKSMRRLLTQVASMLSETHEQSRMAMQMQSEQQSDQPEPARAYTNYAYGP
ncbi:hypothetical protein BH23PAT1_BH23PAT1_3400 [soil metagenome]